MTKFLYLVKSNLTEDSLGQNAKHLVCIPFKSYKKDGTFTIFELSDAPGNNLDRVLFFTVIDINNCFQKTQVNSDEQTLVVLFQGDVYKFADEFQYRALSGFTIASMPIRTITLAS